MQRLIQAQIDQGVEGTRTKNIDLYMSVVPEDWVLHDEAGHTVTRDDLRRGALEQWAIIEKLFLFRHCRPAYATQEPSHCMDIAAMGTLDARTHRPSAR